MICRRPSCALAAGILTGTLVLSPFATKADDSIIRAMPPEVTFSISGGYWAAGENQPGGEHKGYYRLSSVRQPDRTALVYLQKLEVTPTGSTLTGTVQIPMLNNLKARVTDIRPENSDGNIKKPGFFATVYITSAAGTEPQAWTVIVDEFGQLQVGRASN
jgi:hypothetical protein